MKKRIVTLMLALLLVLCALPITRAEALPNSGFSGLVPLDTSGEITDTFRQTFHWNTDNKVASATDNGNITASYITLAFPPGTLNTGSISYSGWSNVECSAGSGADTVRLYFSVDLLQTLNATADLSLNASVFPLKAVLASYIGSARSYGGSLTASVNGQSVHKFKIGQKSDGYDDVDLFNQDRQALGQISTVTGDGSYVLPTDQNVTELLGITGSTVYGVDAGLQLTHGVDGVAYGVYQGYVTNLTAVAADSKGNPLTGVSGINADGKAAIQITPAVYDDMAEDADTVTVTVTVSAQMRGGGEGIGDVKTKTQTFTFTRPGVNVSVNGEVTHSIAASASYRAPLAGTVTPKEGYRLEPSATTVTVGGTALSANDYTFDQTSGQITIPAEKVIGDVVISVGTQKIPVEKVELDQSTLTLTVGETGQLAATVLPANAFDKTVSWSSDNTTVVTVENGQLTALNTGSAQITVTTTDGSKTASCNVVVNPIDITGTATVAGEAVCGQTLTGSYTKGTDAETVTYQWYRGDIAITGATGEAYQVSAQDEGQILTFRVTGTGNYGGVKSAATAQVEGAIPVFTTKPLAFQDLTYNAAQQSLVSTGTVTGGKVLYAMGTGSTDAPQDGWSLYPPKATEAGTYYVWYKVTGDVGYRDIEPVCVSAVIQKYTLTAADFTYSDPASLTYDGQGKTAAVQVAEKWTGIGNVTVSYFVGETELPEAPADAGAYTVKLHVEETDNYNAISGLTASNWGFTVVPKELTLTWGSTELTYTGQAQLPGLTVAGVEGSDDVTVEVTGAGTEANPQGEHYTAQVTLSGADSGNYSLPVSTTQDFVIIKASAATEALEGLGVRNESERGKGDGGITGLTTEMEYATAPDGPWIPVTDPNRSFQPGTYYVRMAGDGNHEPSEPVKLVIAKGKRPVLVPNTGDGAAPVLWLSLVMTAACAVAVLAAQKKKYF